MKHTGLPINVKGLIKSGSQRTLDLSVYLLILVICFHFAQSCVINLHILTKLISGSLASVVEQNKIK